MSGGAEKPGYLMPGMVVGPYTVERQIGGGGFGFVYQVTRDGRAYALKIAHTRLGDLREEDRASTIERLDREIAALKSLHHPGIVRVHSFDRWPQMETGYPYLVMDLVDGAPLQEWREAARPSLERLVLAFEKVADALAHMHELGIIHRDLKSQNILVTSEGEPYIVDFGIARPLVAYDVTRASGVGTLSHFTPEYVVYLDSAAARRGDPFEWKPTTDLYALGFVLYEALAGEPPVPRFAEATARAESELLAAIKTGIPRRPRDHDARVPAALDDLAMELLEKDPALRPQEARSVLARLRAAREAGIAVGVPIWGAPLDDKGEAGEAGEEAAAFALIEGPSKAKPSRAAADAPEARASPAVPAVALPTVDRPVPYRDEGDEAGEAAAKGQATQDRWGTESQILKRAATEWGIATPRARRWPLLAGLAALLVAMGAGMVMGRSAEEKPRPKVLLSATDSVAPSPAAVADPPPLQPAAAPVSAAVRDAPSIAPVQPAASRGAARPPSQRAAKEPLRVPPEDASGILRSRPVGSEPDVLQRSKRIATVGPDPAAGPSSRGVAYGAHIQARLLSSLDSRTIANGPVEAQLPVPYVVRGQVLLPTRTMVYGTASVAGGRFTIRFSRIRTPDDTEIAIQGVALARDDGKPGIAATSRLGLGQEARRQGGLGSSIAKGTGNVLLDIIAGGSPTSVIRSAGQAALNLEDSQPSSGGEEWVLLLDAGAAFDVFVEKAF